MLVFLASPAVAREFYVATDGSHNVYEQLRMHDGQAIGIYSVRGSDNLFLHCDAYQNHDPVSEDRRGGNVDGFGCHPQQGDTGNVFRGCRAWFNSDDGFDCIAAAETVTFEHCWAYGNGYSPSFESRADGNGFKVGGYAATPVSRLPHPIPRHVVRFCVAVKNKAHGFYGNHHIGGSDWFHNTAYRNGVNFNLLSRLADNQTDVPGYGHRLHNNLSFASSTLVTQLDRARSKVASNAFGSGTLGSGTLGSDIQVTADDFQSLEAEQLFASRQADGALPKMTFLYLADDSPLVDAGVDVGLPFLGAAPDLGAFESSAATSR